MMATNHRLRIPPNGGDLVREVFPRSLQSAR